jgi:leucyl aminopeptidase
MIIMRYKPANHVSGKKNSKRMRVGLVGKAVTFDTGGISLKPAKEMWAMKGDMAGGAAVLGAMACIGKIKPRFPVTAVIPAVHNAISDTAYHPGAILHHRSGKTIHVDNTDAEGRLILIDAFEKAKEERVTHLIDLATLTGSCIRALGEGMSGGFGTSEKMLDVLRTAGERSGEIIWPLPLYEEYRERLKHHAADINNVTQNPNAGAITAALFLKEFIPQGIPWIHLDIAGPFIVTKPWKYFKEGGTGYGVRTLVNFIEDVARTGV